MKHSCTSARVAGFALAVSLGLSMMTACTGMNSSSAPNGTAVGSGGSGSGSGRGPGGEASSVQYLYTGGSDNNGNSSITGFQINSNGTLKRVAVTPSPYPLSATKGHLLGLTNCAASCELSFYNVDAATGDLSLAASTASSGGFAVLDPSGAAAYADGGTLPNSTVSAFAVGDGIFSALAGSPYQYSIGGGSNPVAATALLVDPSDKFVFMLLTPQNEHTPSGMFAVALRSSDGSLSGFAPNSPNGGTAACTDGDLAAVSIQGTSLVFQSCGGSFASDFNVLSFMVDQATGSIVGTNGFAETQGGGLALGLALDPSGKWLAVTDVFNGNVHMLAVNSASGALNETADHIFATGNGPNVTAFDGTGKFLYVLNGGSNSAGVAGSGTISAFAFDPSTGLLTPLAGSPFAAQSNASSLVIAQTQ